MSQSTVASNEMGAPAKAKIKLLGMDPPVFMILFAIVLLAMYFKFLPASLAGQLPFLLLMGEAFRFVGDRIPIVKDYLGGGSIVVLFGCSALVMYGIIPQHAAADTKKFMNGTFINFALAALCCGSIFGMKRDLLIKAAIRYIPCIIGGVAVSLLMVGVLGSVLGFGFGPAILFLGLPIMGGGTSAGAVPMSQMFGEIMQRDVGELLAMMTPAVALGNATAIVTAGLLDKLGRAFPWMTGNGSMLRAAGSEMVAEDASKQEPVMDLGVFAAGIAVAGLFLGIGQLVQKFVPSIHAYAWMILLMVIVKAIGIMPAYVEKSCALWYQFFIKNFTNVLLAGLGIGLISLQPVIEAFNLVYVLLVVTTVVGAAIGSALVGWLVGFYPIEAAITSGLCMANMGGSGDIATLSACNRMELMPFAAISSRLGGALILILGSVLLSFLN
ncbi:MAG: Citrate-sodium symporter [Desulfovibrio sp.]